MSVPPVDTWAIREIPGPAFKVGPVCSVPGCRSEAQHAHHIVRRSKTGKPLDWVEVAGKAYPNLAGLCVLHHMAVHEGRAAIRLDLESGEFFWNLVSGRRPDGRWVLHPIGLLEPQPPTPETLAERASGSPPEESVDPCPFCGQRKRRRSGLHPPGRRRKSWTVRVPADAEENGAEVLDALVEDLALVLHVEPNTTGRYYVILPALYYAVQDKPAFVKSLEGVGG